MYAATPVSRFREHFAEVLLTELRRQGVGDATRWQDLLLTRTSFSAVRADSDEDEYDRSRPSFDESDVQFEMNANSARITDSITIAVAETLLKLSQVPSIESVSQWSVRLRNNALTDACAVHVHLLMQRCPRLVLLDLRGNAFSASAENQFRECVAAISMEMEGTEALTHSSSFKGGSCMRSKPVTLLLSANESNQSLSLAPPPPLSLVADPRAVGLHSKEKKDAVGKDTPAHKTTSMQENTDTSGKQPAHTHGSVAKRYMDSSHRQGSVASSAVTDSTLMSSSTKRAGSQGGGGGGRIGVDLEALERRRAELFGKQRQTEHEPQQQQQQQQAEGKEELQKTEKKKPMNSEPQSGAARRPELSMSPVTPPQPSRSFPLDPSALVREASYDSSARWFSPVDIPFSSPTFSQLSPFGAKSHSPLSPSVPKMSSAESLPRAGEPLDAPQQGRNQDETDSTSNRRKSSKGEKLSLLTEKEPSSVRSLFHGTLNDGATSSSSVDPEQGKARSKRNSSQLRDGMKEYSTLLGRSASEIIALAEANPAGASDEDEDENDDGNQGDCIEMSAQTHLVGERRKIEESDATRDRFLIQHDTASESLVDDAATPVGVSAIQLSTREEGEEEEEETLSKRKYGDLSNDTDTIADDDSADEHAQRGESQQRAATVKGCGYSQMFRNELAQRQAEQTQGKGDEAPQPGAHKSQNERAKSSSKRMKAVKDDEQHQQPQDSLDLTANLNAVLDSALVLRGKVKRSKEKQKGKSVGVGNNSDVDSDLELDRITQDERIWSAIHQNEDHTVTFVDHSMNEDDDDDDHGPRYQQPRLQLSTHSFHTLTVLDISDNRLRELKTLPPSLLRLDVSNNHLQTLDGVGQCRMLSILNARNNRIDAVRGLENNLNIAHLFLGKNAIRNASGLGHLWVLETLDLSFNRIVSQAAVRPLSLNTALRHVLLEGNPLVEHLGKSYRPVLRNLCPTLVALDNSRMPYSRRAGESQSEWNRLQVSVCNTNNSLTSGTSLQARSAGTSGLGGGGVNVTAVDGSVNRSRSHPRKAKPNAGTAAMEVLNTPSGMLHYLSRGVTVPDGYKSSDRAAKAAQAIAKYQDERQTEATRRSVIQRGGRGSVREDFIRRLARESQQYLETTIADRLAELHQRQSDRSTHSPESSYANLSSNELQTANASLREQSPYSSTACTSPTNNENRNQRSASMDVKQNARRKGLDELQDDSGTSEGLCYSSRTQNARDDLEVRGATPTKPSRKYSTVEAVSRTSASVSASHDIGSKSSSHAKDGKAVNVEDGDDAPYRSQSSSRPIRRSTTLDPDNWPSLPSHPKAHPGVFARSVEEDRSVPTPEQPTRTSSSTISAQSDERAAPSSEADWKPIGAVKNHSLDSHQLTAHARGKKDAHVEDTWVRSQFIPSPTRDPKSLPLSSVEPTPVRKTAPYSHSETTSSSGGSTAKKVKRKDASHKHQSRTSSHTTENDPQCYPLNSRREGTTEVDSTIGSQVQYASHSSSANAISSTASLLAKDIQLFQSGSVLEQDTSSHPGGEPFRTTMPSDMRMVRSFDRREVLEPTIEWVEESTFNDVPSPLPKPASESHAYGTTSEARRHSSLHQYAPDTNDVKQNYRSTNAITVDPLRFMKRKTESRSPRPAPPSPAQRHSLKPEPERTKSAPTPNKRTGSQKQRESSNNRHSATKDSVNQWIHQLMEDVRAVQVSLKSIILLLYSQRPSKKEIGRRADTQLSPSRTEDAKRQQQLEDRRRCAELIEQSGMMDDVILPESIVRHFGFTAHDLSHPPPLEENLSDASDSDINALNSERSDVLRNIHLLTDAKTCLRYVVALIDQQDEITLQTYVNQIKQYVL